MCQPRQKFIKKLLFVCLICPTFFVRSTASPSGNFWHSLHPHCPHAVIKEIFLSCMSQAPDLFITFLGRSLSFEEYSLIMKRSARSLLGFLACFISIVLNLSYHTLSLPQHLHSHLKTQTIELSKETDSHRSYSIQNLLIIQRKKVSPFTGETFITWRNLKY